MRTWRQKRLCIVRQVYHDLKWSGSEDLRDFCFKNSSICTGQYLIIWTRLFDDQKQKLPGQHSVCLLQCHSWQQFNNACLFHTRVRDMVKFGNRSGKNVRN